MHTVETFCGRGDGAVTHGYLNRRHLEDLELLDSCSSISTNKSQCAQLRHPAITHYPVHSYYAVPGAHRQTYPAAELDSALKRVVPCILICVLTYTMC